MVKTADEWEEIGAVMPAWDYKEEKELSGVYVSREENVGQHNSVMYHIQKEDGSEIGVWDNTVLSDKFAKLVIGDEITISYKGMSESEAGRQYHDFKIIRKKKKTPAVSKESEVKESEGIPF